MSEGAGAVERTKLFVGCFEFAPDEDLAPPDAHGDADHGTFQIVVEARDVNDAATQCRTRLREMASTNDSLGPVLVYVNAFIEVAPSDLARGLVVNHQAFGPGLSYCFLPSQGVVASIEHFLDDDETEDEPGDLAEDEADDDAGHRASATGAAGADEDAELDDEDDAFPSGSLVPVFWAKWKLYWCQTADHNEDWFVVARCAVEAASFHEDAEGYGEGDADAEFVCVLPDAVQRNAEREGGGWPSDELLIACGAEFIPYAPPDGLAELREQLGSGSRIVRIDGRVYSEGDVVSNTRHRLGAGPDA